MNKLSRAINVWRGRIMMALTRNVGRSHKNNQDYFKSAEEVKRILISRPNHRLGNLLLITPLLQEVSETFPNAKIDLFVKGDLPSLVFRLYPNVDRIIQLPRKPFTNLISYLGGWVLLKRRHYDLAMNVICDSSSGRLSVQFANARIKFFGDKGEGMANGDSVHMGKYPVYVFRESIKQLGFSRNERPVPHVDLRLCRSEILAGKKRVYEIVENERKTICLFTYATDMKRYAPDWWNEFYRLLRKNYAEYNIVEVLPVENVSQLSFNVPSYYSGNIRDLGSFIANTAVFIGADSGIMHLASAVHTPTVGLFKVTNAKAYEPYNKDSIGMNTAHLSPRDILKAVDGILSSPLPSNKDQLSRQHAVMAN